MHQWLYMKMLKCCFHQFFNKFKYFSIKLLTQNITTGERDGRIIKITTHGRAPVSSLFVSLCFPFPLCLLLPSLFLCVCMVWAWHSLSHSLSSWIPDQPPHLPSISSSTLHYINPGSPPSLRQIVNSATVIVSWLRPLS